MFTRGQALKNALKEHQGKPYQIAACTRKPANLLIMPSSYKDNAQEDFSAEILARLGSPSSTPIAVPSPSPEVVTTAETTSQTIVETVAIDERPEGLEGFPLVANIWNYLDGKEARSMKQIRDAMRKTERITEDDLKAKFPNVEGYSDALKNVIQFGVGRGFLKEVSEDTYEAIRKH